MARSPHLEAALEAARAAEEVLQRLAGPAHAVRRKADRTPVTDADEEAERVIRGILGGRFPRHGFYGEEGGITGEEAEHLWVVDPIDGTKGFIRGTPFYSTQIALLHRGRPVVGVSSAPAYGELAWAEADRGARLGDRVLRVSSVAALKEATVSIGNVQTLAAGPRWEALGRLVRATDRVRGYGDFLHYHMLAAGAVDAVVESDVDIYDVAALSVIVTEAGGRVTGLDGNPLHLGSRDILATNGPLHDPLLNLLGTPPPPGP